MYYRGAAAAILVYDITRSSTFKTLQNWVEELKSKGPKDIAIAIAGNKADLEDSRVSLVAPSLCGPNVVWLTLSLVCWIAGGRSLRRTRLCERDQRHLLGNQCEGGHQCAGHFREAE